MRCYLFILTAVFAGTCFGQGTLLFEADNPQFGHKSLTVDLRTGLVFLDVTQSQNLSMTDMWRELVPGGKFSGFRMATPEEVSSLFLTAGLDGPVAEIGTPRFENVVRFIRLVGSTDEQNGYPATHALAADRLGYVAFIGGDANAYYIFDPTGPTTTYGIDTRDPRTGHWLVVPEPPTVSILALGLGSTVVYLSNRRRLRNCSSMPS